MTVARKHSNNGYYLGVDVGSLTCDSVLIDQQGRTLSSIVLPTGVSARESAERAMAEIIRQMGVDAGQIRSVISTGYGRERVPFANKTVTEITCHGRGAHFLYPETSLVIDIGGQDSKVIRVDPQGKIVDFVMNDKCAAGTGRFLEVMARALEIDLAEMGPLSCQTGTSCSISSICAVFAESEVISLLAQGHPVAQIVRGIHEAVAHRTKSLAQRLKPVSGEKITLSGGVALNVGIVHALQELWGKDLLIPAQPQLVGALGAALFARECELN